jgi:hypothetical protein
MDFSMCPRAKRTVRFEGEFHFSALKVFCVGDASRFFRAIKVLYPALPVCTATREEANVVLSVATVFSQNSMFRWVALLSL